MRNHYPTLSTHPFIKDKKVINRTLFSHYNGFLHHVANAKSRGACQPSCCWCHYVSSNQITCNQMLKKTSFPHFYFEKSPCPLSPWLKTHADSCWVVICLHSTWAILLWSMRQISHAPLNGNGKKIKIKIK